jgi:hypothetical protein
VLKAAMLLVLQPWRSFPASRGRPGAQGAKHGPHPRRVLRGGTTRLLGRRTRRTFVQAVSRTHHSRTSGYRRSEGYGV